MQPSEWGQFLVGVDDDLAGPARSVRSRQHGSSADMLLLLRMMMERLLMGGVVIAAAVTKVTASSNADSAARSDDHVVVNEVMLGTTHVHLFRGEQDNVANAVHVVCGGYIILAEMSLLQYDQFGRGRARRRRRGRWRHDRRRR